MRILITGVAGFIGSALAHRLLDRGDALIGIDNLNDYYSVRLKEDRLARLLPRDGFAFEAVDFADHDALEHALANHQFDRIVHLGAQAGVRFSIEQPRAYVQSNLVGHFNMLELARHRKSEHLVYASSSSVYGANAKMPFSVDDRVDHPLSLYAATKKADELMSETYAHLYRLPQTGLRFFTVYGPWGRPDMAMWKFTKAILEERPIDVYNFGKMQRDFTFIDDIISGVITCLDHPPADNGAIKAGGSVGPHVIYNIGNNRSEELGDMIDLIEAACGRRAERNFMPMQDGDVPATFANIDAIQRDLGFAPITTIAEGIPRFVTWYKEYHGLA